MKNYRYDKKDESYIVIEQQTNHIVSEVLTKDEARAIVKKLMGGQGFNGWTPSFFLIPIGKKKTPFIEKKEPKNENSDSGKQDGNELSGTSASD